MALTNPSGSTPEIVEMKRLGLPLTMESYLNFVYGGEVQAEGAELELEIPEDLRSGYGYPQITHEDKRKILGENFARLMHIDLN